ncbi:MAG: hypothetical protein AB7Q16_21105 [Vicinamibacterales bacterium]
MSNLSAYSIAILLHLAAAVMLVGGSVFALHVRRAILEAPSVGALRAWLGFARRSSAANPVAALVLLGTGLYLGSRGWWAYSWFYVALAVWLANAMLAGRVLKPAGMAMGAAMAGAPDDAPVDGQVDMLRRSPGWRVAGVVMLASDMAMLFLMVQKPSLVESLAVVLGAMAIGGGITLLRARRSSLVPVSGRPQYNAARDDGHAAAGV